MSIHKRFVCFDKGEQIHIDLEFDAQTNILKAISIDTGVIWINLDIEDGTFDVYIGGIRFNLMTGDIRRIVDNIIRRVFNNITLEQYEKMEKVIDEEAKELVEFLANQMLDDIEDMMKDTIHFVPCMEFEYED